MLGDPLTPGIGTRTTLPVISSEWKIILGQQGKQDVKETFFNDLQIVLLLLLMGSFAHLGPLVEITDCPLI